MSKGDERVGLFNRRRGSTPRSNTNGNQRDVRRESQVKQLQVHSGSGKESFGGALRSFAVDGSEEEVKQEIEKLGRNAKKAISALGTGGQNALHRAVGSNNLDVANLLINNGSDDLINSRDRAGRTPLHYATSKGGMTKMIQLLLNYEVDVDAQDNDGYSALHLCAMQNYLENARRLIEAGADVDAVQKEGWSALLLALRNKNPRMATLLADEGADLSHATDDGLNALHLSEDPDLVTRILNESDCDVNAQTKGGWTPLMTACTEGRGNYRVVELLATQDGIELDKTMDDGRTALHVAVGAGHEDVVAFLIETGASGNQPNIEGTTPLMTALQRKNIPVAELLLDEVNVNVIRKKDDHTALSLTVNYGLKRLVRSLVAKGAKIRAKDVDFAKNGGDMEAFLKFARSSDLSIALRKAHLHKYIPIFYDNELDSLKDTKSLTMDDFLKMGIDEEDVEALKLVLSKEKRSSSKRKSLSKAVRRMSQQVSEKLQSQNSGGLPVLSQIEE